MNKGLRDVEEFFNNIINGVSSLNGQSVRGDLQIPSINLGKDKKDAYVKYAANQYLRKQPITDIPEDVKITKNEIIRELVFRKIKSALKV